MIVQLSHLKETGLVHHGFSTRNGGVSQGAYGTMNLGVFRDTDNHNVHENFKQFAAFVGVDMTTTVMGKQTHGTNVTIVTEADCGKGLFVPTDIEDNDILMTNCPHVALVTFHADCVPLFFLDPVEKVIAMAHAGWRGTRSGVAKVTIDAMVRHYGCEAGNILVGIGPSIGACCFEVDAPVANEFLDTCDGYAPFVVAKEVGKFHIDLWAINRHQLVACGVSDAHIETAHICTCCNPHRFFSHRRDGAHRGTMAAMISLEGSLDKDEK